MKSKNKFLIILCIITSIILFIYLIILAGVTYTDATAFMTMRYLCLGNLYILQTIFIDYIEVKKILVY